jgi:hypothetical protein
MSNYERVADYFGMTGWEFAFFVLAVYAMIFVASWYYFIGRHRTLKDDHGGKYYCEVCNSSVDYSFWEETDDCCRSCCVNESALKDERNLQNRTFEFSGTCIIDGKEVPIQGKIVRPQGSD